MRRQLQFWVFCAAAAFAPALPAHAAAAADLKQNYQSIIDRNPFGLRPPQAPPPAPAPVEEEPEMDIRLTGITSIGYPRIPRRAYFQITKENEKEPAYMNLAENQMQDGIKVLAINPDNSTVRITTPDGETLLSFKTHGIEPPSAPAGMPGQPGAPGSAIPAPPGGGRSVISVSGAAGGAPNIRRVPPRRTIRTPTSASGGNTAYARNLNPSVSRPGSSTPPPLGGSPNNPSPEPSEPIDPAVQYINLKLQEERARQQGRPFPPVPPLLKPPGMP